MLATSNVNCAEPTLGYFLLKKTFNFLEQRGNERLIRFPELDEISHIGARAEKHDLELSGFRKKVVTKPKRVECRIKKQRVHVGPSSLIEKYLVIRLLIFIVR